MLYVRLSSSLRNVEGLSYERGIEVGDGTVWFGRRRSGPMSTVEIRGKPVAGMRFSCGRWHLDEVFVRMNGVQRCLRRAVDHEGEVLEVIAPSTWPRGLR
jgi:putative transposase